MAPERSRAFWDLIVGAGLVGTALDLRVTLLCPDSTATRVGESHSPGTWEVRAYTGARPLDEGSFFATRKVIADTLVQFGCQFRGLSGSKAVQPN